MEALEIRDQSNLTLASATDKNGGRTVGPAMDGRERIRIEFYKTYDVMTGIRIAATLGGFFSMMILLVLYKNYCKPHKTLSEEQLNAAVTAAAEEEDRALAAALEATSFYTSLGKPRESLENTSPGLCSPRFSSVGGGYSHLAPPIRLPFLQQRGKSLPGSALRFASSINQPCDQKDRQEAEYSDEEDFDIECQLPDYCAYGHYLSVPADRRLSSITCSSADSSYLERRGSAFEMGLPAPPPFVRHERDKPFVKNEEPWDFYYPIDIQVIQPTPDISPTTSERTLYEEPHTTYGLQVPGYQDRMHRLSVDRSPIGLAPLASISSLGSFSSNSSPAPARKSNLHADDGAHGCSCHEDSVGSDSVFIDDVDTEDEVDEFSTDSEYDGFDDDYSFCESKQRPVSRCENRTLKFASFDSYDASIGQDSLSEEKDADKGFKKSDDKPVKKSLHRQYSTDLRRQPSVQEGTRVKRKLVKTHSEPRGHKMLKQLPPWVEKGRSGYIPKRQLSVPAARRKRTPDVDVPETPTLQEPEVETANAPKSEPSQDEGNAKDLSKRSPLALPSNSSSSDSLTLTPNVQNPINVSPLQGYNKDMPFTRTLHMSLRPVQEKRGKFEKQKTIVENEKCKESSDLCSTSNEPKSSSLFVKPLDTGGFLKPPNISVSGSCEKLTNPNLFGNCTMLGVPKMDIDMGSCERLNVHPSELEEPAEVFISRTSSQETIC